MSDLAADLEQLGVEVQIAGRTVNPLAPPKPCEHRSFNEQVTYAIIRESTDGPVIGREVMLKGRCGECGAPCRFGATRPSRQVGDHGMVAEVIWDE